MNIDEEEGFYLFDWMFRLGLKRKQFFVYAIIYDFVTRKREKVFSKTLQEYLNSSQQSIARVLKILERKGFIEHIPTKKGYEYTIKATKGE